jgi:ParB/RepB/Spo0J family partition protein
VSKKEEALAQDALKRLEALDRASNGNLIISVDLADLHELPSNPNVMDDIQLDALARSMEQLGFLQPVLVRPRAAGGFEIIDGAHRARAARKLGLTEVPAVQTMKTDAETRVLQIGMNKMRGELDLGSVAQQLSELSGEGWDLSEIALTGFSEDEVAALLRSVNPPEEAPSMGAFEGSEEPERKEVETFVLEVPFTDKKAMQRAKRALKKAGAGDLGQGLLHYIDADD